MWRACTRKGLIARYYFPKSFRRWSVATPRITRFLLFRRIAGEAPPTFSRKSITLYENLRTFLRLRPRLLRRYHRNSRAAGRQCCERGHAHSLCDDRLQHSEYKTESLSPARKKKVCYVRACFFLSAEGAFPFILNLINFHKPLLVIGIGGGASSLDGAKIPRRSPEKSLPPPLYPCGTETAETRRIRVLDIEIPWLWCSPPFPNLITLLSSCFAKPNEVIISRGPVRPRGPLPQTPNTITGREADEINSVYSDI